MKPQVSQQFGECCQVTESGVTEPGLQANSPFMRPSCLSHELSSPGLPASTV